MASSDSKGVCIAGSNSEGEAEVKFVVELLLSINGKKWSGL